MAISCMVNFNSRKDIYFSAIVFHGIVCCVTHLYVQIIIEQSVQVCDATKVQFLFYCLAQKCLI